MHRIVIPVAIAALLTASIPTAVFAQGATQTITVLDVRTLATGLRASQVIGSSVTNANNETIGKVDDVIITRDNQALVAVLSVGGFLGVGDKLVAIRFDELHPAPDHKSFVLAGGTKDGLKSLPEYIYAK
jgi:hypothetical protein